MDPKTPAEWQEAVDCAQFFLMFDSAKQYGLFTGGPMVNLDRCADIVRRGKALGYVPSEIDKLVAKYVESVQL